MAKVKPRRFYLVWDKLGQEWVLNEGKALFCPFFPKGIKKQDAESRARTQVQRLGVPAIFQRKNKDGTIGKGGRSEGSYLCDSKRRKG